MKPCGKRDSKEAAETSIKGKGQESDAEHGTEAENEEITTAKSCMPNNDLSQIRPNETAGGDGYTDSSSFVRAADMGNNSEQHQSSSASPGADNLGCGASKAQWRHSQMMRSGTEVCRVENEKKDEMNLELESSQDVISQHYNTQESLDQDEGNEVRAAVGNSEEGVEQMSAEFSGEKSDEKAGEKNEDVEMLLQSDNTEFTSPQVGYRHVTADKLGSHVSRKDVTTIEPKIVGLQYSPHLTKHQPRGIQGNFVDTNKAENHSSQCSESMKDLCHASQCSESMKDLGHASQCSESMKDLCHVKDGAADTRESAVQDVVSEVFLGKDRQMSDLDKRKLELRISEVDTDVDSHFVNPETCSEDCHIHLNSTDLFVRKRRSIPSFENNTPEKIRKFEKSLSRMSIWSKMEDLCEQSFNCDGKLDSFRQEDAATAQNVPFVNSSRDVRLEQLPVNREFMLSKFLLNPDGFLLRYNLQRSSQDFDGRCGNGTRSKALNNDCDVEIESSAILDKTCHKSRRNDRDNRMLYSSLDWSRIRSHSSSSSGRSSSSDSSHTNACRSCRQPHKPFRRGCSHYNRHSCRSHRGRHKHLNHSSRSTSCGARSRIRSCSQRCFHCLSGILYSHCKSPDIRHVIKTLQLPLVLPASATTLVVAPVTGSTVVGKTPDANSKRNQSPEKNSVPVETSSKTTPVQSEKNKEISGQNDSISNSGNKLKSDTIETSPETSTGTPGTHSAPSSSAANSSGIVSKPVTRNPSHRSEHPSRNMDHSEENFERQRYQQSYEHASYNHAGYHSSADPYFSEDTGYENFEFDGGDYDNFYDEGQDDYSFGQDSYHHPPQRPPGPNMHYPRRAPPQGFRGPMPQMYAPNGPNFGPRGPGMGPRPRMGPNGPMGPQGHRPQIGPGGPMGPGIRGPSRGPPYGPPRQMRPQGMRGPPAPGMMGSAGQIGRGGPYPRFGPTPRAGAPMPRHGSQTPAGPRHRMGPPVSAPPPRDGQYPPPRSGLLPRGLMLNLSQPPPNFNVPPSPALSTSTPNSAKAPDTVEPPPLPPPKPPTPKPPPPPKKEEEKKEEIKPMAPLIPPEQAEQYRRLREQARKHARKQLRKQEHRAKGEPESSDEDDEEKAKRKEYETRLAAEREDMEKAALLAAQDEQAVSYDDGATILMQAPQQALIQQPTYVFQHHPMTTLPSSYGLMSAPHFVHSAHPSLHPSQLQNVQFMAQPAQPQLVQLPNGQVAYASPAPMTYQTMGPMVSMSPQGMSAAGMPHQMMLSSGGMHQVATHPGIAVSGNHYMSHVMAAQIQAAQQQAAAQQAAQVQAAQQAAQVQAAQVQAAQVQAAQAQQAQLHGYIPGVHMPQHLMSAISPQGQIILVPRVARPQM